MNTDVRRLCATVLIFEAIVVPLSIPVAIKVEHADVTVAAVVGGGLALCCVLLCGLLRYRWAYVVGSAVQVAAIATGVLVSAMYVLGAVFALLWAVGIWLPLSHQHRAGTADVNH